MDQSLFFHLKNSSCEIINRRWSYCLQADKEEKSRINLVPYQTFSNNSLIFKSSSSNAIPLNVAYERFHFHNSASQ